MGHERSQMLCVTSIRLLTRACTKGFDEMQKGGRVVPGDRPVSAGIIAIRSKDALRNDGCRAALIVTREKSKLGEVAGRPTWEFSEALELATIAVTPACRVH